MVGLDSGKSLCSFSRAASMEQCSTPMQKWCTRGGPPFAPSPGEGPRRLRRHIYARNTPSPRVLCYPRGPTVGRRDRPRIGAACPLVRLVSGVGDHITGDRPCPEPVWETARCSVTPAPTAVLRPLPTLGGCHDTPQRLWP